MNIKQIGVINFDNDKTPQTPNSTLDQKAVNTESISLDSLENRYNYIDEKFVPIEDLNMTLEQFGKIFGIEGEDLTPSHCGIYNIYNADGEYEYSEIYLSTDDKDYIYYCNISGDPQNGFNFTNIIEKQKLIGDFYPRAILSYKLVDGRREVLAKDPYGRIFNYTIDSNDVLQKIEYSDDIILQCGLSNEQKSQIRGLINLDDNIEIIGYQTINIDGKNVNFYVTGDTSLYQIYDASLNIQKSINSLPDYTKNLFLNNPDFKGFFIGSLEESPYRGSPDSENGFVTLAYAHGSKYIFLNNNIKRCVKIDNIEHEMGHTIDHILDSNYSYSENSFGFKFLYEMYKKPIIDAFGSLGGYGGYEEMPDEAEFFAKAVAIYLNRPDDLKILMPDLYKSIDKTLNGGRDLNYVLKTNINRAKDYVNNFIEGVENNE